MLHRVQGFVLDFLIAMGLPDRDGFAAEVAQAYIAKRPTATRDEFVGRASRIKTTTFTARSRERTSLTTLLTKRLDAKFLAAISTSKVQLEPSAYQTRKMRRLRPRVSRKAGWQEFEELLVEFKKAVEARGVDEFWQSRKTGTLWHRAEKIGQQALTMFLYVPMSVRRGFVLREVRSGIGYIDVMAVFGPSTRYVAELKILSTSNLRGATQLSRYLDTEGLDRGWMVVFDARPPTSRSPLATDEAVVLSKTIRTIVIDINPIRPSSLAS